MDFARFGWFGGAPDGKIRFVRSLLRFVMVLERTGTRFWHWVLKIELLTVEIPWCFFINTKNPNFLEKHSRRGRGFH